MSATTKERILDAAESIMLEKSFHSVGLNEILKAVKVPKGSFYHYFSSKEQFGVELLRHYCTDSTAYRTKLLLSPTPQTDPYERLFTYLEGNVAKFAEHDGRCTCLAVKLATEVADFSDPMRQVLSEAIGDWIAIYAKLIAEGQAKSKFNLNLEPTPTACLIYDLWNGALNRSATCRCVKPLRQAIEFLRAELKPG